MTDPLDDLSAKIDHFGETALRIKAERDALQDERDELLEILHDLVQDECEKRAIGGGPGWKERHEKTWARAMELFEP